jgi:high-affinity iron transporter
MPGKKFYKFFVLFLAFLAALFLSKGVFAQDTNSQEQARTLINLLDYVSQDYAKAVSNGQVINAGEYNEMIDFSGETISIFDSIALKVAIGNKKEISQRLKFLHKLIKQKSSKEVIAENAQQIKKMMMLLQLIEVSPAQYPDIAKGRKLFRANCQSCHGKGGAGDGPLSVSFDPRPVNFLSDSLMQFVSPLQVFNTTRLGVRGTGMPAFDKLSDKEIWQISFYIKSLPLENKFSKKSDSLEKIYKKIQRNNPLSDVAHLSDIELGKRFSATEREKNLAALRLHQPGNNESASLSLASTYLDDALSLYKNHQVTLAGEKAMFSYLDGVEPEEQHLSAKDPNIVAELEL